MRRMSNITLRIRSVWQLLGARVADTKKFLGARRRRLRLYCDARECTMGKS